MTTETLEQDLTVEGEDEKPMPGFNHASVQINLGVEFAKHREYRVTSELTLDTVPKPLTPDLCVSPRQPLDLLQEPSRCSDPPLLVVEISSPSQSLQALYDKVPIYFRFGVKSCWIVIVPMGAIHILTADGRTEKITAGIAKNPVTGVTAELDAVFS